MPCLFFVRMGRHLTSSNQKRVNYFQKRKKAPIVQRFVIKLLVIVALTITACGFKYSYGTLPTVAQFQNDV
ncbi:hypothetical protein HMPREF9554_01759 [Treponema phagedenis F0421]|nr:hypothetical protein HMPREF9554_01759 [Treponema phagedenis F0421]